MIDAVVQDVWPSALTTSLKVCGPAAQIVYCCIISSVLLWYDYGSCCIITMMLGSVVALANWMA